MDVAGTNHVIGGSAPGDGQRHRGRRLLPGHRCLGGSGHVVQGNFIGTDVTGTRDLGNHRMGINAAGTRHRRSAAPGRRGQPHRLQRRDVRAAAGIVGQRPADPDPRQPHLREQDRRRQRRARDRPLTPAAVAGLTPERRGRRRRRAERVAELPDPDLRGTRRPQGAGTRIQGVLNSTAASTLRPRLLLESRLRAAAAGVPGGRGRTSARPRSRPTAPATRPST